MKPSLYTLTLLFSLSLLLPLSARAYYSPEQGRWINRDPVGERGGINLSAFLCNGPVARYDRLGLQSAPVRPGAPAEMGPCEKFEEWYKKEKADTGWMKELPNCPCYIKVTKVCALVGAGPVSLTKELAEVSSDKDAGWQFDSDLVVFITRKGVAANCIRSAPKSAGGPRQECCYDSNGKLITGGAGPGTVDRGSGDQHVPLDYEPYKLAAKCDAIKGGNECVLKYLEVRPVNNGNNCDRNVPEEKGR